jgi:hypothetical protein
MRGRGKQAATSNAFNSELLQPCQYALLSQQNKTHPGIASGVIPPYLDKEAVMHFVIQLE